MMKLTSIITDKITQNICIENNTDFKWIIENIDNIDKNIILYFINNQNLITKEQEKIQNDKKTFLKAWKNFLKKEKLTQNSYNFLTYKDKKQIFKKFNIEELNLNYSELLKNNINLTFNKMNKILKILENARSCYSLKEFNNECYYINKTEKIPKINNIIDKKHFEKFMEKKLKENKIIELEIIGQSFEKNNTDVYYYIIKGKE